MTSLQINIAEPFLPLFERNRWRYKIYYGGRGGAKSWAFAQALLALGYQSQIRVLCARELQKSIKDSVMQLLKDLIKAEPIYATFYETLTTEIRGKNGTQFGFCGLKHNSTEIKSYEGCDYVWIEEAQAVSNQSWETLIPTIRKPGSEIWACFNPKNPTDPTWQRFCVHPSDDTLAVKVGWQDNPYFPDVLDKERRKLQKQDPEAYEHIWEGQFDTRFSGAVYARHVQDAIDNGRIGEWYDATLPVHTAWDLGFDDSTAIIFWQRAGDEVRIIDCYEASGEDIPHYARILDERGYRYGDHFVPHDAANKLLAAGGKSIVQQLWDLGHKTRVIPASTQQNQIEAGRKVLRKTWWCADKTKDLVHALMAYHFEYDEDRQVFKSTPCHDWSSHFADAFEVLALSLQKEIKPDKPAKARFLNDLTADDIFGDIYAPDRYERIK